MERHPATLRGVGPYAEKEYEKHISTRIQLIQRTGNRHEQQQRTEISRVRHSAGGTTDVPGAIGDQCGDAVRVRRGHRVPR